MTKEKYEKIESYMLSCMKDSAHDREHIYRVVYNALEIAKTEKNVNYDVLITASLLHDIGRQEQYENPELCHAMVGGDKAYRFLREQNYEEQFSEQVRSCIQTHRYRKNNPPESIEAKILFDADKLDVSGAIGIARTLIYKGFVGEPIYSLLPNGMISNGEDDLGPSFFREYKYKLEKIYSNFYTVKGAALAKNRQKIAVEYYNSLLHEVSDSFESGKAELERILRTND